MKAKAQDHVNDKVDVVEIVGVNGEPIQGESVETVAQDLVASAAVTQLDPIMRMIAHGASIEQVKELVQLYREERAYKAEELFNRDFARFQADLTPIPHDREAKFATKAGTPVTYTYATLGTVQRHIGPALHANGFSYDWDRRTVDGTLMQVCVLRHRGGHKREASFPLILEGSTLRSKAQDIKAGSTFAQRCSLIAVCGLTTAEEDNDGVGLGDGAAEMDGGTATENQVLDLLALADEVGTRRDLLLTIAGVESFDDLPASSVTMLVRMLEMKRQKRKPEAVQE